MFLNISAKCFQFLWNFPKFSLNYFIKVFLKNMAKIFLEFTQTSVMLQLIFFFLFLMFQNCFAKFRNFVLENLFLSKIGRLCRLAKNRKKDEIL